MVPKDDIQLTERDREALAAIDNAAKQYERYIEVARFVAACKPHPESEVWIHNPETPLSISVNKV